METEILEKRASSSAECFLCGVRIQGHHPVVTAAYKAMKLFSKQLIALLRPMPTLTRFGSDAITSTSKPAHR